MPNKPRSAAQKAATRKMIAANRAAAGGKRKGRKKSKHKGAATLSGVAARVTRLETFEHKQMGFNKAVSSELSTMSHAVRQIYSGGARRLGSGR